MFSIKKNIFCLIFLNSLFEIQSLIELPVAEDNEIVLTELAVRNTVNRIFSILKLKHVQNKARFTEFAAIHNFFVTITLQDHDNLKEIAKLARVDNIDNKTQYFITQLNEVLNEDNKSYETTDDVDVTTHIETFIRKLEYLKYQYGFTNNAAGFGINTEVLSHLRTTDSLNNFTTVAEDTTDADGNILSDNEFWKPSGRRIFEGRREKIKRFPFMASVHFFKKFQCGGSIIKSDLVITAASCLQLAWNNRFFRENPAFLSVQVGCDLYEGGEENIPIMEVYFHPEYNPKNLRNNLAIMRLLRILKFGRRVEKIKKIDFDRDPWPLPHTTNGITIIGWGARSSNNIIHNIWSNRLAYAELDFYPLKECQDVYSREYVTYKNFCAGFFSKGGGACNRDVGGPGVAHGVLVGVVSFGSPNCGAPDAPTVFTKLGYYTEWIEGILEMETATGIRRTTERRRRSTFDFAYYLSTTASYKINPVTDVVNTLDHSPLPIQSLDALRALDENKLFKDFITTMFGSEEVKEYLDQYDYETDKSAEAKAKLAEVAAAGKEATRVNDVTTPATIKIEDQILANIELPEDQNEVGSVKMVTTIDEFDRLEVSSVEEETTTVTSTTPEILGYTSLDSKESGKKVEESIAKLIDDIDIQELLAFDSDDSSSDKETTTKSNQPALEEKRDKIDKLVESGSEDSTSDDDDDDDDSDDKSGSGNPLLALLELTKNSMKKKGKKGKGLTIPADAFKDFTFRQNTTSSPGILDIFSQNDLMKLLTEAVADATKSKSYKIKK